MMQWLRQGIGLPDTFSGVIQDTASSATLAAVLVMRERAVNWEGNVKGLSHFAPLRIYCSDQVHTSIDRAIWVAGIGQDNLVKTPTSGPMKAMDSAALQAAIDADRAAGYLPAGIIAATGATGMGACDDLNAIADISEREGLYTHLDAAWAGTAMTCSEFRTMWEGVERFDSVVFNPHKWLGAQFDCAAHFLRDPDALRQTLAIRPEYLRTHGTEDVTDCSEWSVPLGRRFRALKLWFVMRNYGMEGLRSRIRNHVKWSQALCNRLRQHDDFEIKTDPILSL
jgi:aromatic-L-amino-acid decarboxylase